ncbi:MAG: molybdopterin biosynthesis protein [Candidatus Hydrothermarchaeota archaeon]
MKIARDLKGEKKSKWYFSVGGIYIHQNFLDTIPLSKAIELVRENFPPRQKENISISKAHKRVLAEDVFSKIDVPPFDRSTMDGFAVIAEDTYSATQENPVRLKIVENEELKRGECVYVNTGSPIPDGANAVVMVEYGETHGESVLIHRGVKPGENIIYTGSDIKLGELLLRESKLLEVKEIGILASAGIEEVSVYKKPKVAIISTGNELQEIGEELEPGKVYDVNTHILSSAVEECGGMPAPIGIVEDSYDKIKNSILGSTDSDIILVSGGTSRGREDLVYRVVGDIGDIYFHGLAVKPGKPTFFGKIRDKPIFGLPGNPFSAITIFDLIVAPMIRWLCGLKNPKKIVVKAKLPHNIVSKGRHEFLPVKIRKGRNTVAYPIISSSSSVKSFLLADGYFEIPQNAVLFEGEEVDVIMRAVEPDLIFSGSYCLGVDYILKRMMEEYEVKIIDDDTSRGLSSLKNEEYDLIGIDHLGDLDLFNLRDKGIKLIRGYQRKLGLIFREGIESLWDLVEKDVVFLNKGENSAARMLLDNLLRKECEKRNLNFRETLRSINGYEKRVKDDHSMGMHIKKGRADIGIGTSQIAELYGLNFIYLGKDNYDFAFKKDSEMVERFIELLVDSRHILEKMGFMTENIGDLKC